MSEFRLVHFGIASLAAVAMASPVAGRSYRAACDADSPGARSFIASANSTFPHLDSLRRARLGWRTAPHSVILVTREATCDSVLAAHNRFVAGQNAAYRVSRAVIAKAGSAFLLELPPAQVPAERMIFIYDSTLKFTAIY
jgi:hypothetical protein